jgi:hypothetical protein
VVRFVAVIVFAETIFVKVMSIQESKNLCQHFASTYASPSCSYLTLSVCHPQLHSQPARESLVNVRNPFVPHSLQPLPSRLNQGITSRKVEIQFFSLYAFYPTKLKINFTATFRAG